jgi:Leucine-rich repeat (LRR) protein
MGGGEAGAVVTSESEGRADASRRIAECRALQADELDLGGLQLTVLDDEFLKPLCELTWLRRLFLGPSAEARQSTQLAFMTRKQRSQVCNALDALPAALFDALSRLEELDLAHNGLRGLPATIAGLTALTSLDLSDNKIGDKGAQALKDLNTLTSLDISHNNIRSDGAKALKGLAALTSPNLGGNKIGAEGAKALTGLTALTTLDLSHNNIGEGWMEALKGLSSLTDLNLICIAGADDVAKALKVAIPQVTIYL